VPVIENNRKLLIVRLDLNFGEVSGLLARHRTEYPTSAFIEQEARQLKAADFPAEKSLSFIENVFSWSKNSRNLSRVQETSGAEVTNFLREASQEIEHGEEPKAIETLCKIPYLGVSYASKIARFLDPEKCVVLDSIIRERLGYPNDINGYAAFLKDCREMLEMLKASSLLDSEFRAKLRVCDVEAALFMKAKELNNVSP